MKDEGWKGKEALNPDLEFWNVVSTPATPEEVEELKVGEAIYVERGRLRQISIVRDKWVTDEGETQIRLTNPKRGEKYDAPTLTIIASMK